jgi:DNA adenine methylase
MTILRYPGGKNRVKKKILKYFPSNFKEYREPFCGGGSIFFSVPKDKKRWINDINKYLIGLYIELRDNSKNFISQCKKISPHLEGEETVSARENSKSKKKYNKRLKERFDYFVENKNEYPALSYFYINRTVWAGRVNYSSEMKSRMYFSNPEGWNIVKTNKLETASSILKNTKITSLDYSVLLEEKSEHNNDEVLLYLDPPYVIETNMKKTDKLYEYGFTNSDHDNFVSSVKNCDYKWILSYDDNPITRVEFKDFNIYEEEWAYSGSSLKKKKIGKELIITNF